MDLALLDTDIVSEIIKLRHPTVRQHALAYTRQHGALAFSAMTRYEVVRGYRDQGATTQLARFATFCQHATIFAVTDAVFDRAADLWVIGQKGGHPHGDADLIIAATALEHGRVLVTGNTPHFAWIPGLRLADWPGVSILSKDKIPVDTVPDNVKAELREWSNSVLKEEYIPKDLLKSLHTIGKVTLFLELAWSDKICHSSIFRLMWTYLERRKRVYWRS